VIVALVIAERTAGPASYGTYPQLHAGGGAAEVAGIAAALAVVALLPFADRRGIAR
jgi:hypothetical protein